MTTSELLARVAEIERLLPGWEQYGEPQDPAEDGAHIVAYLCRSLRAALQDVQRLEQVHEVLTSAPVRRIVTAVRGMAPLRWPDSALCVDGPDLCMVVERIDGAANLSRPRAAALSSPEGASK